MEIHRLRFQEAYIIYRPLARLAFLGNGAMADLAERVAQDPECTAGENEREALDFLQRIGFLKPDPPRPAIPSGTPFRPTVAVLCLTTACNMRCVYCYAQGGEESERSLRFEAGKTAIDEVCTNARAKGEERFGLVFHGGGEPTTALESMQQFAAHARNRSLPCHISCATNGLWGPATTAWLLDNLDEISLSLDGLPDIQNRQRPAANGAATFDAVLASARAMDARNFAYGARLTVTDDSIDDLPAGVELLCRETDCRVFQVEPAFSHGRALRDGRALTANERFVQAFIQAYDVGARHGRHVYYSGARPWLTTARFCGALDKALVVTPGGQLTACYEVCSPGHPLASRFLYGRLTDGTEVDDLTRRRLLESVIRRRALCWDCLCHWSCAGDCPSKSMSADGEGDLGFGARCEVNRAITRELLIRLIEAGNGVWMAKEELRALPDDRWVS